MSTGIAWHQMRFSAEGCLCKSAGLSGFRKGEESKRAERLLHRSYQGCKTAWNPDATENKIPHLISSAERQEVDLPAAFYENAWFVLRKTILSEAMESLNVVTTHNNPFSQGHSVSWSKEQPEHQIKTSYLYHCPNSRLKKTPKLLSKVYSLEFDIKLCKHAHSSTSYQQKCRL